jgi:hypothetical protein
MSGETRTYAIYKEFCGNREQPWVTRISEAADWTHQPTTRDQVCIEAVLDTLTRRAPSRPLPVRQCGGWVRQRTWAKRRSSCL